MWVNVLMTILVSPNLLNISIVRLFKANMSYR